ncbi:SecE/Sec61-gamma subunits of protein translocation complex [Lentinula edodes]|uniref:SecE/Sec61-gamma subunits of protein translocation complex n=1 Tax=Lentinula edodes TaxID=5353 RepID=G9FIJ2_LENED|nr:SecE/Sec61-gamma subunits of protein translocation complex [Lentinula edodes]AEN14427.1 SecE/Sec61-gamma subunits of protein translocation complex [Lentinula edodes]KAH7880945.1 SecE/Sec61-gamma subunits of protein translocation complex [Lentinula edodes]KAJ3909417.1 SecE/Sec61-gamma subunits of protein translocation complex [Lentinula edodes]KAJ3919667.1 SecE/Sec61-gamma subunits of protein translocation complex [Lentinula edodes]
MSDKLREFVEIPQQFVQDGNQFLTRCTKPSQKEFVQICKAVAVGFAVMGFIGYFVKLIHIPINNILVYVSFTVYNCCLTNFRIFRFLLSANTNKRVHVPLLLHLVRERQTVSSPDTVPLSTADDGALLNLVLDPLADAISRIPTGGNRAKFDSEMAISVI